MSTCRSENRLAPRTHYTQNMPFGYSCFLAPLLASVICTEGSVKPCLPLYITWKQNMCRHTHTVSALSQLSFPLWKQAVLWVNHISSSQCFFFFFFNDHFILWWFLFRLMRMQCYGWVSGLVPIRKQSAKSYPSNYLVRWLMNEFTHLFIYSQSYLVVKI